MLWHGRCWRDVLRYSLPRLWKTQAAFSIVARLLGEGCEGRLVPHIYAHKRRTELLNAKKGFVFRERWNIGAALWSCGDRQKRLGGTASVCFCAYFSSIEDARQRERTAERRVSAPFWFAERHGFVISVVQNARCTKCNASFSKFNEDTLGDSTVFVGIQLLWNSSMKRVKVRVLPPWSAFLVVSPGLGSLVSRRSRAFQDFES